MSQDQQVLLGAGIGLVVVGAVIVALGAPVISLLPLVTIGAALYVIAVRPR